MVQRAQYVDATFYQPVIASVTAATDLSGTMPMLTLSANGVQDADANVTSVTFFREKGGTPVAVGTADGTNGWSVEVDPRTLSGSETFFAVATDDATYQSVPEAVTVNPVVIGAVSASNADLYATGQTLTLSAADLLDWNVGASVSNVKFYPAASDGSYDSSLTPLGTAASADSDGNWRVNVTPSGWTGEQTIYAVATDSAGTHSMPVALVVDPHQAPTIDGVSATADPSGGDAASTITLTANGVGDGSAVASVAFYQVGNSTALGTETATEFLANSATGWSIGGVDTSGFSGSQQFYAVVTNDAGQTTTSPTLTVGEIAVGSFTTNPGQYVAGQSLTLTANDILDWNSGSPGQTITFYQDTTGSGDFADATALPTGTGASYTFSASDTSDWTDPQTFWAQVTDADGGVSAPVEITVYPDQAPTVDSISAVSDTSASPTTLDLTRTLTLASRRRTNGIAIWFAQSA